VYEIYSSVVRAVGDMNFVGGGSFRSSGENGFRGKPEIAMSGVEVQYKPMGPALRCGEGEISQELGGRLV